MTTLVVFDDRGRYPEVLLAPNRDHCLAGAPRWIGWPEIHAGCFGRPGMRDAMTERDGAARTSPYTPPTMETGIRGDRRADVDALYAEAREALTQSANRLRVLTERLREVHAAELDKPRSASDPRRAVRSTRDQQARTRHVPTRCSAGWSSSPVTSKTASGTSSAA